MPETIEEVGAGAIALLSIPARRLDDGMFQDDMGRIWENPPQEITVGGTEFQYSDSEDVGLAAREVEYMWHFLRK